MKRKLHIRKGDTVKVISGEAKNSEKNTGKVLMVDTKKNRAIVEGLNMVAKHTKPNTANPQGGIIKKEASIHLSNLKLIDPKTGEPTRTGRRLDEKTNKMMRFSKKSNELV